MLLALAAAGTIALKGVAISAPEAVLAAKAERAITDRLASQGFAVRIERHRVQNNIVLGERPGCWIGARDASGGAAMVTIFARQAAAIGPVRYLYRGASAAAPPDLRIMADRIVPRSLDRLGIHLARSLPVALASSGGCPAGNFGLEDLRVSP
jgi:hypothetical protein